MIVHVCLFNPIEKEPILAANLKSNYYYVCTLDSICYPFSM